MSEKNKPLWSALSLAWELGYTIAIPIVVLALVGRLLDRYFIASPWFLLTGIFLSLIVSSTAVYLKVTRLFAEIEKESRATSNLKSKTRSS